MEKPIQDLLATGKSILLFDGVCNLCNGAVQFIIERDRQEQFFFASLQSDAGQALLREYGMKAEELKTLILIDGDGAHARSKAALRCARRLSGGWPLLYAFIIVPRPIRDAVYDWVAANRYRWFGKQESCMIPTPDLKSRFL